VRLTNEVMAVCDGHFIAVSSHPICFDLQNSG